MPLKIIVVGSGGREHALVEACLKSSEVATVVALPGNGGMRQVVECVDISVTDIDAIVDYAKGFAADLVICGPEVPLSLGLADALDAEGIPVFGPKEHGARLEASKAFCKDFLQRHAVPTAAYQTFSDLDAALGYLDSQSFPLVIKASGLAAGKGVIIAEDRATAEQTLCEMLSGDAFGESGKTVVIEEFMTGEEASLHLIVSDGNYLIMPMSQDHKRIGEGDTGLNTGGMGAYAPTGAVNNQMMEQIEREIIAPTMAGFAADQMPYRGTLYIGLMLTPSGPKVVEFNVRFGDPETQVLLPMIDTDIVPILNAAARGEPLPDRLPIKDGFSMVVVLAAGGYPGSYAKGDPITFPESLPKNAFVYHAGTELGTDGRIVTSGGRVLGVTGFGTDIQSAASAAYAACDEILWKGKTLRRDIGHRELKRGC
ncbi:MAG: phosphoribosylamine--glycine ligase [Opitutales bacterium]|nr:phosphoribosylamine--glycine ligase [Opitutales bacterium]NRA27300.1 phosphoribosylamine--glycine ligase [Opitutales bacterium]